jgi:hypothetical protein
LNKKKEEVKEELSENMVWDIIQFSNALSNIYPNFFTPAMTNSRLKDVSLLTTGGVTEDRVEKALANPKESERELLAISESLEYSSTSYKRILQYMANLPAWDWTYYCKNIGEISNYKSKKYQKSLDVMKRFFDRFDVKKEFSTVVKQLFREETFFSVLRKEGEKYTLQELQGDYCLITGRWDQGLLFTFDYMFFNRGGVDIDLFPPIFKKTYSRLFKDARANDYDPSLSVDLRGNSTFVYQADCSPEDNFWAWKLSPELITRIPYFSGLFPDLAMQSLIRGLQKSSYMASAAKLIFGEIPYNKDIKASVKDALGISPKLLGEFLQLVKSGVNNEAVKITSAPLQNIQAMEFTPDKDMYSSYLHTVLGISGINSNLLFSTGIKPNQTETILSANVDELVALSIYPYFNNFLDYHVNNELKEAKCEHRFGFNFEGSNFYLDRDRRLETQIKLMDKGAVNPQKVSAALGQNPFVFQSQLDEARINGWTDNLTPIISSFQQSGAVDKGRPKKSDSELGDAGAQTRSDGSNISKGGKTE